MFNIGASELLVIVIVAVLVIGPKDLPLALRTAGRWIGKIRRVSAQFRSGFDSMVREAEMEDMEKKWRDQNARIMAEHPGDTSADSANISGSGEMTPLAAPTASIDRGTGSAPDTGEPQLPLGKPEAK